MPDMVETYAGIWNPWWAGISPTVKQTRILNGPVDADTMMAEAGVDWSVSKKPAFVTGEHAGRIPGWNAVQRDTDGAIYGMVKDTYSLFQNAEGFANFGLLMDASGGEVDFLTGGALFGGALVWALAKVDNDLYIKGDGSPYEDYILGLWGHDGRHGYTLADTLTRVVCWNTASAALSGSRHKITIRHTSGMSGRLDEARKALDLHAKYTGRLVVILNDLAERPMTTDAVKDFTIALLPSNPDVEHAIRTEKERATIVGLYENSETLVGVAPTAYRAYQAVTEYVDHVKDVRATKTANALDRRALSIIEGPGYDLKASALRLLVKA